MMTVDIMEPSKNNITLLKLISRRDIKTQSFNNFCELEKSSLNYITLSNNKIIPTLLTIYLETITNVIYYAYPAKFPIQLSADLASETLLKSSKEKMKKAEGTITFLAKVDDNDKGILRVYLSPNMECWKSMNSILGNDENLKNLELLTKNERLSKQTIFVLDLELKNNCEIEGQIALQCVSANILAISPIIINGKREVYYLSEKNIIIRDRIVFNINKCYKTTFSNLTDPYKKQLQDFNEPGGILDEQLIYVRLLDTLPSGYPTDSNDRLKSLLLTTPSPILYNPFITTYFLTQVTGGKNLRNRAPRRVSKKKPI